MGTDGWARNAPRPCANGCGKYGYMNNSRWYRLWSRDGPDIVVCSNACGERLNAKIEAGMVEDPMRPWYEDRFDALRLEIATLRGRLRSSARHMRMGCADMVNERDEVDNRN